MTRTKTFIIIQILMSWTMAMGKDTIPLPSPRLDGAMSLEQTLAQRRSVRDYSPAPISLADLGQLLWAGQGITSADGKRTAPSAGALYPLELYAAVSRIDGLEPGFYHYLPSQSAPTLERLQIGDLAERIAESALNQECIKMAAVTIIIGAVNERTAVKYGTRTERYVNFEVGHAAENICLEAVALGLGAVTVGAFYEEEIKLALPMDSEPLYLIPIGKPAKP